MKLSLKITESRYNFGVAARADVVTAQTQLLSSQAQQINAKIQRGILEHALAVLIGEQPANFSLTPSAMRTDVPTVPAGIPSTLLERRPDIAEAERKVAAANAQIGVAKAAYYPDLTLSGSDDYTSSTFSHLISAPNRVWSFGPQLAETLFDGGLRRAEVAQARAQFDASAANYRSTVVSAFQQVEDDLATLNHDHDAALQERAAVDAAQRTVGFAMILYKQGATDYLTVVTAQTALLQNQLQALDLDTQQLRASVDLIRALGGGWEDSKAGQNGAPMESERGG